MPTWLAVVSYLLALFLLVSTTLHPVVVLIFPTWVVVAGLVVSSAPVASLNRPHPKGNPHTRTRLRTVRPHR